MSLQKSYSHSSHISNQAEPLPLPLHKKYTSNLLYPSLAKMVGVNKFLRIYYARAMETLKQQ